MTEITLLVAATLAGTVVMVIFFRVANMAEQLEELEAIVEEIRSTVAPNSLQPQAMAAEILTLRKRVAELESQHCATDGCKGPADYCYDCATNGSAAQKLLTVKEELIQSQRGLIEEVCKREAEAQARAAETDELLETLAKQEAHAQERAYNAEQRVTVLEAELQSWAKAIKGNTDYQELARKYELERKPK